MTTRTGDIQSDQRGIRVAVIYEPGRRLKPIWFELRGEQLKILEVCYFWESTLGEAPIFNFSLMTDKGLYELAFNTLKHSWQLAEAPTEA